MKPGDLVRRKYSVLDKKLGTFIGFVKSGDYEYAEVMWFDRYTPNGTKISTIQKNLIEVVL